MVGFSEAISTTILCGSPSFRSGKKEVRSKQYGGKPYAWRGYHHRHRKAIVTGRTAYNGIDLGRNGFEIEVVCKKMTHLWAPGAGPPVKFVKYGKATPASCPPRGVRSPCYWKIRVSAFSYKLDTYPELPVNFQTHRFQPRSEG